jgi:hypothetical protein
MGKAMKTTTLLATALALMAFALGSPAFAQANRVDGLVNLPFAENRPTAATAQILRDELLFQRATQAYLWALPLINTLGMKTGSEKAFGAGYNVLPVWKKRLDARTLVTTPNSDVIYAMSYVDLGKDGPLVFEAPPNLQGILLDFWQRPIPVDGGKFFGDLGLPGPDAGKGGKFLLLPPGYSGAVPEGYYVYRSATNNVFIFLRSFYQDPKDLTPAVAPVEQSKIYPLGGQATAKPMQFPDASGVPANMLPTSDGSAFDQLKQLVDSEGAGLAESDSLSMLATIGIVKGRPSIPTRGHARSSIGPPRPPTRRAASSAWKRPCGAAPSVSIPTAAGSIPWPTGHRPTRRGRWTSAGKGLPGTISISTPASGSSPTTTRSARA